MRLALSFTELNPIYKEDYDTGEGYRNRILMGYFRELPDFEFQSPFSTYRNSKDEYIKTKTSSRE